MSARTATWIAMPICLLNIGLAVFGLVFGMLNGDALLELLDEDAPARFWLSRSPLSGR